MKRVRVSITLMHQDTDVQTGAVCPMPTSVSLHALPSAAKQEGMDPAMKKFDETRCLESAYAGWR